jgi:transcriptional regulator with XRE-family HTH domain
MEAMATEPAIGTRIKRARERKRWTQKRLAGLVGVSQKTIDNWENGRTEPRSSIGALEEVLGVSLTGEPAPRPVISGDLMAAIMDDPELTESERRVVIDAVEAQLARERAQRGASAPAPAAGPGQQQPAS